jgi:hypothetical protein
MQPGEDHDIALPRPSYEGLYGTIYCSRCEFFGLGYNHPEWCTWEWLKKTDAAQHSLDLIELGALVVETFEEQPVARRCYPVVVRISVEASDEDEARLQIERLLAGRFDFDFVASVETRGRRR